jgi:hypothetical protein
MVEEQNIEKNKTKNVRLKNIKFKEERKLILNKIFDILNITNNNKIFYTHLLDENEDMQNKILALDNDIETYFRVTLWAAYKQSSRYTIERRYLALIKSIFKDMNVKYESASIRKKYNNKTIYTTMYTIESLE